MAKLSVVRAPVLNAYLDDGGDAIVVWEQTSDGPIEKRVPAEYVTWHRAEQLGGERMRQLKNLSTVHSIKVQGEWVRIGWTDEWARRNGRSGMREYGIETYEGDVDPVRLWLTDARRDVARPRRCYLDIEADSRVPFSQKEEMRILVWAISDDTGPIARGVLSEDTDEDEERLLAEMWKVLDRYDQVCAWYGGRPDNKDIGFDFYVIAQRTLKRGLPIDWRRWLWLDQLAAWARMNQHSAESGAEKESMRLEDIAQAVLGEGKTKAPKMVTDRFGDRKGLGALAWELWEAGGAFRDLLVSYCVEDTELLRKLEKKKGYLTLFQTVCEACAVFGATRGLFPSIQMDGFMLRLGRDKNYRFPTKVYGDDEENKPKKYRGAWVMTPRSVGNDRKNEDGTPSDWTTAQAREWRHARGMKTGILRDVHVADFSGMYPNIILTWNLSEDTKLGRMSEKEWKALPPEERKGKCRSPGTGLITRTDVEGILVIAVREMIRLRKYWADLAASLPPGTPEWFDAMGRSTAYKVVANSFYGVTGQRGGRFCDVEIAESITQNGVYLIRATIREAERRNMEAIYSDTDSGMIIGPSRKGFDSFCRWANSVLYPKIANDCGCVENTTKIAFEKSFERLIFTSAKRYIGRFSHYKGTPSDRACHGLVGSFKDGAFHWFAPDDKKKERPLFTKDVCPKCGDIGKLLGKPEIKGLEYKRGDANVIARKLQGQMIDLLVGGCTFKDEHGVEQPYNPDVDTPTEEIEIYHAVISKIREYVLSSPLSRDEVRRAQALKKPLKEYETKTKDDGTPGNDLAHVGVARELERRGQAVTEGTRIEYVVVDGDASPMRVIPAEDYANDVDRFYLWDTMVFPPTERLLTGAFPDHDWAKWGDVRPKKARGRAKKVLPGQLGFALSTSTREADDAELAVAAYAVKPLVVRIHEDGGEEMLNRVKEVFKRFPGARSVEVVIELRTGAAATLAIPARVSPSSAFRDALDQAMGVDRAIGS
jgi:DNA polymerase elongation subunit (family B)